MIIVEILKDEKQAIIGYEVFGHSNYDEYGNDIVCSAVSVLAQTTLMSLVDVCGIEEENIEYKVEEEIGYLEVILKEDLELTKFDKAQIVLRTFELGVKSTAENYSKYVTLKYREV